MQKSATGSFTNREQRIPSKQEVLLLEAFLFKPNSWRYGYDLERETGVAGGTIYPLLRKLYRDGYLEKSSDIFDGKPRNYYCLTERGLVFATERLELAEVERKCKDVSRKQTRDAI